MYIGVTLDTWQIAIVHTVEYLLHSCACVAAYHTVLTSMRLWSSVCVCTAIPRWLNKIVEQDAWSTK